MPELTVLPSPLACVGFSHTIERQTAERVRQLVVWPEQARKSWQRKRLSGIDLEAEAGRPFVTYTRTEDGASITTETRILRWMFGRKHFTDEEGYSNVEETTEFQLGGQLAAGYITDTTDLSDTDDEALRESSTESGSIVGLQTPPLEAPQQPTSPRDSAIPIAWSRANRRSTISLKSQGQRQSTDRAGRKRCLQLDLRGLEDEQVETPDALQSRVYHMDKSGLVTRFSNLLDSGSVRMLYSSTFHTANILVEAKDVHRAKRLLQGREQSPVKGYF